MSLAPHRISTMQVTFCLMAKCSISPAKKESILDLAVRITELSALFMQMQKAAQQ